MTAPWPAKMLREVAGETTARVTPAARLTAIEVDCEANASAGFRRGLGGLARRQMVLRIGHPQPGPTPPPTGRRPLTAVFHYEE